MDSPFQTRQHLTIFLCSPETPERKLMGSRDRSTFEGYCEVFPSSLFTEPIMLQPSCPLRPNNLGEKTCLCAEVQTYCKVAQEGLYVQIPETKSVKRLKGIMSISVVCESHFVASGVMKHC